MKFEVDVKVSQADDKHEDVREPNAKERPLINKIVKSALTPDDDVLSDWQDELMEVNGFGYDEEENKIGPSMMTLLNKLKATGEVAGLSKKDLEHLEDVEHTYGGGPRHPSTPKGWWRTNIKDIRRYIVSLREQVGPLTATRLREAIEEDSGEPISLDEASKLLKGQ